LPLASHPSSPVSAAGGVLAPAALNALPVSVLGVTSASDKAAGPEHHRTGGSSRCTAGGTGAVTDPGSL
jgi:hypothetical protein